MKVLAATFSLRNGFPDATTEARRVEACWGRWPAANVGDPTGGRGGLLVLDADPRGSGPVSADTRYRQ